MKEERFATLSAKPKKRLDLIVGALLFLLLFRVKRVIIKMSFSRSRAKKTDCCVPELLQKKSTAARCAAGPGLVIAIAKVLFATVAAVKSYIN